MGLPSPGEMRGCRPNPATGVDHWAVAVLLRPAFGWIEAQTFARNGVKSVPSS